MTPMQISGMIDRIAGMYPTANFAKKTMAATWSQDEFLLAQPVEDVRRVLPLVETHGKIPSLPEMKTLLRMLYKREQPENPVAECCQCGGSGFWDGVRVTDAEMFEGKWVKLGTVISERFTVTRNGMVYNEVRKCSKCNVITNSGYGSDMVYNN